LEKQEILNIIITQAPAQEEEKFNRWYNEVHIPMLLKCPKVQSAARYKVVGDTAQPGQYVAAYRFKNKADFEAFLKSPERDAALKEMQGTWGNKIKIISIVPCESIKDWQP
jgi:uncharacterized protein (TIGR02118 family)